MACTCKVGPGKFEGEPVIVFMAYEQMCLGNCDLSIGRYDFFKTPFQFDADASVVEAARRYGYCDECIKQYDADRDYGMAIYERDDGFVCSDFFATEDEWETAIRLADENEQDEEDA